MYYVNICVSVPNFMEKLSRTCFQHSVIMGNKQGILIELMVMQNDYAIRRQLWQAVWVFTY